MQNDINCTIPIDVDRYFTPFYYFLKKHGYELESAIYDPDDEKAACKFTFVEGIDFRKFVSFLNLPNKKLELSNMVTSVDESYNLHLGRDGKIFMTFSKEFHVAIICYIIANH